MRRRIRNLAAISATLTATFTGGLALPALATAGDTASSFGTNGIRVSTTVGTNAGLVVQDDGRIVIARNLASGNVEISRLTTSGKLDTSFSGDGRLELAPQRDQIQGMALAVDGSRIVLLAADRLFGVDMKIEVDRMTSAGALDQTFGGGDGRALFAGSAADREPQAIAVMADRRILVVANDDEGATAPVVHRLTTTGAPDPTFGGGDGEANVPVGILPASASAIDVGADGGIVVSSQRGGGPVPVVTVVSRMGSSGDAVKAFGKQGAAILEKPGSLATQGWDVEFTAEGKVVGGGYSVASSTSRPRYLAYRLTSRGNLDTSFSGDGFQTIGFATDQAFAYSIAQQADGKLLIVGVVVDSNDWAIARLTLSGALDPSFSTDGRATLDMGTVSNTFAAFSAVSPNGKRLYVGGTKQTDTYHVVIAALRLE